MNLEARIFPSPSAASSPSGEGPQILPEISQSPIERPIDNYHFLIEKNADQLFDYLRYDIARAEEEIYGSTDAESKLIFTYGNFVNDPDTTDISKATTFEGTSIYKTKPDLRKSAEIQEWIHWANSINNENDPRIEGLISESADLFYNLTRLSTLDSNELHPHCPDYEMIMGMIARSLGWSRKEALLMAASKYHRRFIEVKNKEPEEEMKLMQDLIKVNKFSADYMPLVKTPTKIQINSTWGLLEKIQMHTLRPRHSQIIEGKKAKQNGIIYSAWR